MTLGGNSVGYLYTDSLYLGCFKFFSIQNVPVLTNSISIPYPLGGADVIRYCYDQAVLTNAFFFALRDGNICLFGSENEAFDSLGPVDECNSLCGFESSFSGTVCGGFASISVYQVEVNLVEHLTNYRPSQEIRMVIIWGVTQT